MQEYEVHIIGFVAKALELKTAASGAVYCHFCITKRQKPNSKKKTVVLIHSWGAPAAAIAEKYKLGEEIEIFGELANGSDKDGKVYTFVELQGFRPIAKNT